jgi:hypothetical protein
MYIIYESLPGDDPRLDPRMEYFASEWHYTIAYINDIHRGDIKLDWLPHEELTDDQALAWKFTNAVDGEISVMQSVSNPKDLILPTSFGDNDYEKVQYKLTSVDEANAVGLLKKVMLLHAEKYFNEETGLIQIKSEVPGLRNLKETQMYMATYFEWECAYTAAKDKAPRFQTKTFSEKLFD